MGRKDPRGHSQKGEQAMNDKKIINAALWFFALCVLVILLTSCNPYVTQEPTGTPEATTTILSIEPSVTPSATSETCTVATGYDAGALNIRTGPGTQYGVIRTLAEGETLQVIERAAWLQVIDATGTRGFINARYCHE